MERKTMTIHRSGQRGISLLHGSQQSTTEQNREQSTPRRPKEGREKQPTALDSDSFESNAVHRDSKQIRKNAEAKAWQPHIDQMTSDQESR